MKYPRTETAYEMERSSCPTCRAVFRGRFARCPNDGAKLVATVADPLVGMLLDGRYFVERLLGEGGIGRVYACRHVRMSRRFAVKVPFGEFAFDPKVRRRLSNEADAAARLQHPNVVSVVDVGETDAGLFYLTMDLAEGDDLASVLDFGPLGERRALTIFAQIADGLAHAHSRGLIHRDLKPCNIILETRDDGTDLPRIVDFGIAIPRDRPWRMTTEGIVLGTPFYMSPEQATGETLDHRTDLYSLGIVLYEMLAGKLPFEGTPIEVARANLSDPLPSIAARNPAVTVEPVTEGLVRWLTEKKADRRPADADVVRDTVTLLLQNRIAADAPGATPPATPPVREVPIEIADTEPVAIASIAPRTSWQPFALVLVAVAAFLVAAWWIYAT